MCVRCPNMAVKEAEEDAAGEDDEDDNEPKLDAVLSPKGKEKHKLKAQKV